MWEKKIREAVSSYIFFSHIFLSGGLPGTSHFLSVDLGCLLALSSAESASKQLAPQQRRYPERSL
jgi:hypothetical protein